MSYLTYRIDTSKNAVAHIIFCEPFGGRYVKKALSICWGLSVVKGEAKQSKGERHCSLSDSHHPPLPQKKHRKGQEEPQDDKPTQFGSMRSWGSTTTSPLSSPKRLFSCDSEASAFGKASSWRTLEPSNPAPMSMAFPGFPASLFLLPLMLVLCLPFSVSHAYSEIQKTPLPGILFSIILVSSRVLYLFAGIPAVLKDKFLLFMCSLFGKHHSFTEIMVIFCTILLFLPNKKKGIFFCSSGVDFYSLSC